jgi:integrase
MSTSKRSPALRGIEDRTDRRGRTTYRGTAYDKRTDMRLRGPWTASLAEAKSWRVDALARLQDGTLSGDRGPTLRAAAGAWLAGIRDGSIRNRSGRVYKPSAVSGYERDMRGRILPVFGAARLAHLTLPDVQRWADRLAGEGLSPSTVRNIINPLRALYAWALPRGLARLNPCAGLRLPTGEKARDRIAAPSEAARLIAALAPRDQAAMGLAVYAGVRLGELLALELGPRSTSTGARCASSRSWDPHARRFVEPKSDAGVRTVPIIDRLATLLADHAVLTDHRPGLLFPGAVPALPVHPASLRERMTRAWTAAQLRPLHFHEGRHTFASLMIAAGVNAKALSTFMGHASITITLDRYGHLFPGAEHEARGRLNTYLSGFDA